MRNQLLLLILFYPLLTYSQIIMTKKSELYQIGWNKLEQIDGEAGLQVVQNLQDISPELSDYIIEYAFGNVYNEQHLTDKQKEIVALCSLIAQRAVPEIKVHLHGALNTGNTVIELKDIILQMSIYTGFPKSITAMKLLKEVLEERVNKGIVDIMGTPLVFDESTSRRDNGSTQLAILDPLQEQRLYDLLGESSPALIRFTMEHAFGDIYAKSTLDSKSKQLATIAALATLGNAVDQLKFHINAGLQVGLTTAQINEIMLLMTVYAGFPAAFNGVNALNAVVEAQNK
ncbi:carboxymuconolactone decarboxylase family protein [Flavobacterium sp. HSC-61S13]|uniref:carboxymuconolactone decarboxylase family protein n=1 Tax=Flavobacterium sp. HSC-61S13 TaxID=2910963 RepID=UPI0020A21EDA|nr:carboxymuconolactone decarboxylase family protein [Flavobacterium sp. HSC-61S13]MCP1996252.1 4-carboxymuconolactone decarboxylase [Flavobacterium sp. HSC-61S13]